MKKYIGLTIISTILLVSCADETDNANNMYNQIEEKTTQLRAYICETNNESLVGCWVTEQCSLSYIGTGGVQTYTAASISIQKNGYLVEKISRYDNSDCNGTPISENEFTATQFNKDYQLLESITLSDGITAQTIKFILNDNSHSFGLFNIQNNRLCFMPGMIKNQPGLAALNLPINSKNDLVKEIDYQSCMTYQEVK